MVVRSRARAILIPLFFYLVLGSASAYLVKNASQGQHGTEARAAFDRESTDLTAQLASLQEERERWRHRVDSLRNESIDRDLLEQEARARLNRVSKDEVVIFTDPRPRR
ncbi:MAG: septum formation initiator family protein [Pseudomonadota bacterium]|nr:septum formation initiator family protein [Pseudomonadota bacterium]